jgi:squalene-associated FAD-dependent desaturase
VSHVHIIGAGLAGLSAAVALTQAGRRVTLYEAGPAAGGRCRSYFDKALGARIDNGNHLLLSGNDAAMNFLSVVGSQDTMGGPGTAYFPFIDLVTMERWAVEPGDGRIPWWIFSRRVPGTRLSDYLALLRLRFAKPGASVESCIGGTALYRRLLEPLAVSGLNTAADTALASLMWAVVEGSLLRGGAACVPLVPKIGLSESFIDPAIAWLEARGGTLRTSSRVTTLGIHDNRVTSLHLASGPTALAPGDAVVLAVPAWVAAELVPGLVVPDQFESILNVHFKMEAEPGRAGFVGLVGGTAEWIFIKPGIVSVTVSAANRLLDIPSEEIVALVWQDIEKTLDISTPMPQTRLVKEKRATFAANRANEAKRPNATIGLSHFAVAGDFTATGLPATIEGAIRSGQTAAQALSAFAA